MDKLWKDWNDNYVVFPNYKISAILVVFAYYHGVYAIVSCQFRAFKGKNRIHFYYFREGSVLLLYHPFIYYSCACCNFCKSFRFRMATFSFAWLDIRVKNIKRLWFQFSSCLCRVDKCHYYYLSFMQMVWQI